jgi:hypothetical protein
VAEEEGLSGGVSTAVCRSNGVSHGVFPAILKPKTAINAGETLRSSGYQIEAKRAVKAGAAISVLVFLDGAMLSIEAEAGKVESQAKPWFTAYKDDTKASDRSALVEAWRLENQHVGK